MAAFNWRTQSGQEYTDSDLLRSENPDEFYRMMAFQAGQRESGLANKRKRIPSTKIQVHRVAADI